MSYQHTTHRNRHSAKRVAVLAIGLAALPLATGQAGGDDLEGEEPGDWSLVTTARGHGRFAAAEPKAASVVIDVGDGTWRNSGKVAGARPSPITAVAGFEVPAGCSDPRFSQPREMVACRVAIEGEVAKGKVPAGEGLRLIHIGKGREFDLLGKATIHEFVWSPDGGSLACSHDGGLTVFSAGDGSKVLEVDYAKLDPELYAHAARHLTWRPDGGALAFRVLFLGGRFSDGEEPTRVAGDLDVYVSNLESKETRTIKLPGDLVADPWSSLVPVRWQRPGEGPFQIGIPR